MAESRSHGTRDHSSTTGKATGEEEGDLFFEKPYRRRVGTYAMQYGIQKPRPKVQIESEQESQRRQQLEFQPPQPCAATTYSHHEMKNAFRSNIRHFHDPEDRFEFPLTANQQVGWGAKKMPPTEYRCPLKSSQLTKVAEKLAVQPK